MAEEEIQNEVELGQPGGGLLYKFVLSGISAMAAESVTYPLDLTRTRLQIQGESSTNGSTLTHSKRGMLKIMHGVVTEEGLLKLWQGISPALYRQIIYSGSRMIIYEALRDHVFKKNEDGTFSLWKSVIVSATCGACGQLIASPTDLVKIQMQMEGRRRLEGKPVRVKNCSQAFRTIYKESGIAGLWRGWIPNCQRAVLCNVGDLVTYDMVKRQLLTKTTLPDNFIVHVTSSACAGLMAAIMSVPADVVKTRVMNQPTENGKPLLYKGSIDCAVKTITQEGFFALYKGFFPTYCRFAPWSMTFWVVYEQLRKHSGHASF